MSISQKQQLIFEKQFDKANQTKITQTKPTVQFIKSEKIQSYKQKIGQFCSQSINKKCKQNQIDQLAKWKILYSPQNVDKYKKQLTIQMVSHSTNFEVVELSVSYCQFSMNLTILNVEDESPFHIQNCLSSGSYGEVYRSSSKNQFAVKCLSFNSINQRGVKHMAIRQYFIFKIAAFLQIAPVSNKFFGFDLIFYKNCIEFSMELCVMIRRQHLKYIPIKQTLISHLHKLHQWKIIHFDLKPENIMFSNLLNKYVFIDFGLSKIIDQPIGFKYCTRFIGTLQYCSEEMSQIFYTDKQKYIDAYFNDLVCLQKVVDQIKKDISIKSSLFSFVPNLMEINKFEINLQNIILIYQIKYFLYYDQISHVTTLLNGHELTSSKFILQSIFDFLLQLSPNRSLKIFYNGIESYLKQSEKYQFLNKMYRLNSLMSPYFLPIQQLKKQNLEQRNVYLLSQDESYLYEIKYTKLQQECIKFLYQKQLLEKAQPILIFRIYSQYISFSNNIYKINMKQRVKVSSNLLIYKFKNHNHQSLNQPQIQIIKHTVLLVIQQCLYYNSSKFGSVKNIIFELVEQLLIMQTDIQIFFEIVEKVEKHLMDFYDKFMFLLNIKNHFCWISSMVSYSKTIPNVIISVKFINFFKQKLAQLNNKFPSYSNFINCFDEDFDQSDYVKMQNFPHDLQIKRQINYLFRQLRKGILLNKSQWEQTLHRMFILQNQNRQKIHFFYDTLFYIYHIWRNQEMCYQILHIYQTNIQCSEITDNLNYNLKIARIEKDQSPEKYLDCCIKFLENLHILDCIENYYEIKQIIYYVRKLLGKDKLSQVFNQKLNQIKQGFKTIYNFLTNYLLHYKLQAHFLSQDHHECYLFTHSLIKIELYNTLVDLFKYQDLNFKSIQKYNHLLQIRRTSCSSCRFGASFYYNIGNLIQAHRQLNYQQFEECYQSIVSLLNSISSIESLQLNKEYQIIFRILVAQLCESNNYLEARYKGLQQLYFYMNRDDLWQIYFPKDQNSRVLIFPTLQLLLKVNINQFFNFVMVIVNYLNQNDILINHIFFGNIFTSLFSKLDQQQITSIHSFLEIKINLLQKASYNFIIIYKPLFQIIADPNIFQKLRFRILKLFSNRSLHQNYYESWIINFYLSNKTQYFFENNKKKMNYYRIKYLKNSQFRSQVFYFFKYKNIDLSKEKLLQKKIKQIQSFNQIIKK